MMMVRSVVCCPLLFWMSTYSLTVVTARSTASITTTQKSTARTTTTARPSFETPCTSFVPTSRRGGVCYGARTTSSRHAQRRIPILGIRETNHNYYCLDGSPLQPPIVLATAIPRGGQRAGYGGDGGGDDDDDNDYYSYRNDYSRYPSSSSSSTTTSTRSYPNNDNDYNDDYSYGSSTGRDRSAGGYDDYDDYDDRGISSSRRDGSGSGTRATTPRTTSSSFADRLPAIIRTGNRQVGLPLLGIGAALTILGMSLFFNKTLMRLGNLFFVAGVPMTLGPGRTAGYFFQPKKARATACLALGLFLVFVGWPIVGILLEGFGLLNLFGNMFPVAMIVLKQMPVIGPLLKGDFGGSGGSNKNNNNSNSSRRRVSSYDDYYDDRYSEPDDRGWDRQYDEPNNFQGADDDNLQGYY